MYIGPAKKRTYEIASSAITKSKTILSTRSSEDFITIPIPMENVTRSFLYSFLSGLKKVVISTGTDKKLSIYKLRER